MMVKLNSLMLLFTAFNGALLASVSKYSINSNLILTATKNPIAADDNTTVISTGLMELVLLEILAERLNFTYTIQPPRDMLSSGSLQRNGLWTGATGQLQRREVDMYVTTTTPTPLRRLVVDISYPVIFIDTAIVIPFPSEGDKTQALFLAFDSAVIDAEVLYSYRIEHQNLANVFFKSWVGVGISFLVIIVAFWFLHNATNTSDDATQNAFNYWIFYMIGVWTTQGVTFRNPATAFRLAGSSALLGIYLLSNYYTGAYTSIISIPTYRGLVDSIENLATSQSIVTQTVKGSSTEEYVMQATDPSIRKIAEQLRLNPSRSLPNVFTVDDISSLVRDRQVLLIPQPSGESLIQRSYEINKRCKVTLADKSFYSRSQSFSFPKDSPLLPLVDREVLLMHETGLIIYALKRADMFRRNPCILSSGSGQKRQGGQRQQQAGPLVRIKFGDLSGAFIILGVGLALGLVSFAFELVTGPRLGISDAKCFVKKRASKAKNSKQ